MDCPVHAGRTAGPIHPRAVLLFCHLVVAIGHNTFLWARNTGAVTRGQGCASVQNPLSNTHKSSASSALAQSGPRRPTEEDAVRPQTPVPPRINAAGGGGGGRHWDSWHADKKRADGECGESDKRRALEDREGRQRAVSCRGEGARGEGRRR